MSENEVQLPIPSYRPKRWVFLRNPWLIVVALALGLAFWQWFETRARLAETQQELARRLGESDASAKLTRGEAAKVQEQVLALSGTGEKPRRCQPAGN
ncbi:MAG: putative enzyme of heme biosynthesis [Proteobacteria bacterium]|nr:putative enzyme of heme biosynthesis [Pseudomonadota bacterium]